MSQTDYTDELEQYRSSAGVGSKTADISSDDHALKQEFGGDDEQKSFVSRQATHNDRKF